MDFEQKVLEVYRDIKQRYYEEVTYDPKNKAVDECIIMDWVCDEIDADIKDIIRQHRTWGPQA